MYWSQGTEYIQFCVPQNVLVSRYRIKALKIYNNFFIITQIARSILTQKMGNVPQNVVCSTADLEPFDLGSIGPFL